jgi:hypothetical protein
MRLVKLLPRWFTPRVESEPYDRPQDDPPQGDVAENEASGFRGPNPPADLQEARRSAKERYQLIAEALKREAGVRRHYTHKSISGVVGARSFQNGDSITRRSTDLIGVRIPIKPSQSPPHRSRPTSRDFVHWRLSNACRRRVWMGSWCRRPKTFTAADLCTAA